MKQDGARSPIVQFLRVLPKPCEHLADHFHAIGIDTLEDLVTLSTMTEDCINGVKIELLGRGVTLFEWVNIEQGLRDLAKATETVRRERA